MGTLKGITSEIPESIFTIWTVLSIFDYSLMKVEVLLEVELLVTSCTSIYQP